MPKLMKFFEIGAEVHPCRSSIARLAWPTSRSGNFNRFNLSKLQPFLITGIVKSKIYPEVFKISFGIVEIVYISVFL